MADVHEDDLDDVERELLMAQPDSLRDVNVQSVLDTFVDAYPTDEEGMSSARLNDVSRELNFQVSQSYDTFENEEALQEYNKMLHANGGDALPRGLLGLPPLECDSVMFRGDSGVCIWATVDPASTDHDGQETDDVRRQAQRAQSGALQTTSIETMLAEYHSKKGELDEKRVSGEQERKRRRLDVELREKQRVAALEEGPAASLSVSDQLWVAKYGPRSFKDLLSDESANLRIVQWVKGWNGYVFEDPTNVRNDGSARRATRKTIPMGGPKQKSTATTTDSDLLLGAKPDADTASTTSAVRPLDRILLIVGPPGVGKTTLAHVIAAHCGYEAREINASSDRTVSVLNAMISDAIANSGKHAAAMVPTQPPSDVASPPVPNKPLQTLLRPKCLIIDEMDGIHANVVSMLLKKDIHRPVLCLANNLYAPALRELRASSATIIQIPPIVPSRLVQRLEYIASRERLDVDRGTLSELVQVSNGDVRCCLNTLQFLRRSPGERVSAHDLQRALSQLRGKDTTLGLWPLWTDTFTRKDKQKYMALLQSEFQIQWDHVIAAQSTATGTAPSRVDPGFVYMSRRLGSCGDVDALVDGLFQHYSQQRYSDYSLEKTRRCVDAFALQDLITTHGFRNGAVGLADKFAVVTGAACFASCSSLNRGQPLTFPREGQLFRDQLMRGQEAAHSFAQHASGPVAIHYNAVPSVALDVAPLVPRCLVNSLIKFPGHSFASLRTLSHVDQKLFQEAVDRHVEYGLTYVPDGGDRRQWATTQDDGGQRWVLQPPLHALGCVSHNHHHHGSYDRSSGRSVFFKKFSSPQTKQFATPGSGKSEDDASTKQKEPLILRVRDEVKQLLAGEIANARIRKHYAHFREPAPLVSPVSSMPTPTQSASTSAAPPPETMRNVLSPPKPLVGTKRTPVKRDFFGRPVVRSEPPPAPPLIAQQAGCHPPGAEAPQSHSRPTKLPPTHQVKYIYFDGSTNAVKLPAQLSDF